MAAESFQTLDHAVTEFQRRLHRDAPVRAKVDKASVLAHLRAQLAELQASEEVADGNA